MIYIPKDGDFIRRVNIPDELTHEQILATNLGQRDNVGVYGEHPTEDALCFVYFGKGQYDWAWRMVTERECENELFLTDILGDDSAVISKTPHEIQSGFDRVRFAESLILQLPADHDGRNTWLLNYGTSDEAMNLRTEAKQRKPTKRYGMIGNRRVVLPEREPPKFEQGVWVAWVEHEGVILWCDNKWLTEMLKAGRLFLTLEDKEAAEAAWKALTMESEEQ